jgi:hypothetical protein
MINTVGFVLMILATDVIYLSFIGLENFVVGEKNEQASCIPFRHCPNK